MIITGEQAVQGSDAWLEFRKSHCPASEAGALMSVNPWKPKNPYELMLIRNGEDSVFQSKAMAWGTEHEDRARLELEEASGLIFQPQVLAEEIDGVPMSASLDGITMDGKVIAEIKCPYGQKESDTWKAIEEGNAPVYYWWQMQQQLLLTGAEICWFAVWTPEEMMMIEVLPDEKAQSVLVLAWQEFWSLFLKGEYPVNPNEERDDEDWEAATVAYWVADERLKKAKEAHDIAKKSLVSIAGEQKAKGYGTQLVKTEKKGNLSYSKYIKDEGIKVPEEYRGKGSTSYSVRRYDQ